MTDDRAPRTNWPHDVPDARELVEAVRDYLADELGPRAEGRDRWMVRIAANALTIAAREIETGPADAAAHAERLALFGVTSDAELAAQVRRGEFDAGASDVALALWATTLDKIAVANPGYRDESLEPPRLL